MTGLELGIEESMFGNNILLISTNEKEFNGKLIDWTSEWDNETDGESITLEMSDGGYIEFYTAEIKSIEKTCKSME